MEIDIYLEFLRQKGVCVVPGSGFGQRPGTWHFRYTLQHYRISAPQPTILYVVHSVVRSLFSHMDKSLTVHVCVGGGGGGGGGGGEETWFNLQTNRLL